MDRSRVLAAGASFSLLGAAFGYVIASTYLTYRFGGSLQDPDFLFLARNLTALRDRAPAEFLTAGAIMGGFVLLGLALTGVAAQEKLTSFGQTTWQTPVQMKRNGFLGAPGRGFLLGKLGPPKSRRPYLASTTFPHALLVAPTGRGKGVGFVIPNLLTFKGSVVVLDVKGENFLETSRHRTSIGDRVIRFAPADWDGHPTFRYNPLQRIYEMKNPDRQMMELRLTAGLFLQSDSERVSGLLQGGINLFVAAGMLAFERDTPTLGAIHRLVSEGSDKQKAYAKLGREARHPAVKLMFEGLASINNDTLTSYLSLLLTSGLDTWSNGAIAAATSASDFSFRDLRKRPHAIYLEVAPDMVRPLAPLIRLFFSDLIASLQAKEPGPDEPWPVMILLDEFDRLGRMPIVAESIKTLRSYGAHLALVTQTIPALDEIYGENTRLSLQGGAGVKLYLTPSDQKTVAELSQSVGRTTKRVISRSHPLGPHTLKSRTLTERTEDAPLLSEDQARTMSLEDVVLVIDAQSPIRAKRIKYYEDPLLRATHAAQSGPYPYPDPISGKMAQLDQTSEAHAVRIAEQEARIAALETRAETSPTAPVPPSPTPSTPELMTPSVRRARIKSADRAPVATQLTPGDVPEEDRDKLRRGVGRLSEIKAGQADDSSRTLATRTETSALRHRSADGL